jgi:hypothetical protein
MIADLTYSIRVFSGHTQGSPLALIIDDTFEFHPAILDADG